MMREHVEPTARIHYMITEGGTAVNVVPEKAVLMMTFRDISRSNVEAGVAWIKDMAKGAALCTQTEGVAIPYFGLHDLLPNTPFANRMQEHYKVVGLPEYTEEEKKFATDLQKAAGVEEAGLSSDLRPIPNEVPRGGFSDMGDVSYNTPTMGIVVPSVPKGVALHSWPATASHGTSIGFKSAETASQILTLTGIDILTDADFRQEVRADFEKRTEGYTYKSPIPDSIKEPSGLPDEMRQFGTQAQIKEAILNGAGDHGLGHSHEHDHSH